MSEDTFKHKNVLITGAGSGIGFETALAFAAIGADIIATDINLVGLEVLQSQIAPRGGKCIIRLLDVRDASAWQELVSELEQQDAIPDVVVNNAGLGYVKNFRETSEENWRMTLDVNILGVAFGCRAFLDTWRQRNIAGHLVNISSMAAYAPLPNLSAYVASKYAVEGLSEVLMLELAADGITVSCVHPGVIDTPIVKNPEMIGLNQQQMEKLQKHYREQGVHPRVVAKDIVEGVKHKTGTILSGKDTSMVKLMKWLLPRKVYRKILLKEAFKIGYLTER